MRLDRRSPPVAAGEISPVAAKRCNQRTALAILTPKRLAAALRDIPPSTTASTTRLRRSSESAIPAASFARRESSITTQPIRESPLDSARSDTALTVSAASQLIGFGRNTLERAMSLGALPYMTYEGRRIVDRDAATAFRAKLVQLALEEGLAIRKDDGRVA